MAKTTSILALPYPETTDSDNVPADIKALAEALDALKLGSRSLKPTLGIKAASADLTLTGSYQDIAGTTLTITPAVASFLKVTACFDFVAPGEGIGTVRLDTVDQTPQARSISGGTATQVYALALTAAEHTIKLRGKGSSGSVLAANTRFLYELVAS